METDNFTHLVRNAQSGSPEAFALLVTRFHKMAYGYAYAILGDFELAQDAAQEAFIEAFQVLPTLREPLAFPTWLKRIIFKYCDRLIRRIHPRTIPLEGIVEVPCTQPSLYELVERNELSGQVREAMCAIPPNLRIVTILFYSGGYSHQDIADFLGVPVKTVKSRLHRSRERLKERLLDMVQDELAHNPLPEKFTQETVEQAVKRAAELNKEGQFDEAEKLLRSLIAQVPEHPVALRELNRAVLRGRVYGQGQWDLLTELAAQGKVILKTIHDDEIHRQVAQTLLAIPAIDNATSFLESWIAEKGPSIDRLGMLAWAKGCRGDFAAARALWDELLPMAQEQPGGQVSFIAYSLVSCFSAGGELASAQIIARQAWNMGRSSGGLSATGTFTDDCDWLALWHLAKLDVNEIGSILLERHPESADLTEQAGRLCIQGWLEPPDEIAAARMSWAMACIDSGNIGLLKTYRLAILGGLRSRGLWKEANQLAAGIWQMLGTAQMPEAEKARDQWDWERFNPVWAIKTESWQDAQELVQAEIDARGVQGAVGWAAIVAGGSGSPTPAEIMRALEEDGLSKVDEYGMFGWYLIAREAAHAGDLPKSFDALRKALSYWSNAPYWITDIWEKDAYWGDICNHAEFKQAFDQRRKRIGRIYGELHYFPEW